MYVFNLINFIKLCRLLATLFNTQKTFQRCLNVVVRVIWLRAVGQYRINVKRTLCMYSLKFTTLNNVELTLSISTLILKTLGNAKTMLLFWTSSFTMVINVETALCVWPFSESWKEQKAFLSFKKKVTHSIKNICFRLWSIKKKGKHGTYNIKINVGNYNAWYMKRIWNNSISLLLTK